MFIGKSSKGSTLINNDIRCATEVELLFIVDILFNAFNNPKENE